MKYFSRHRVYFFKLAGLFLVLLLSHSNSKAQGSCIDYIYRCVEVFDDESNPLEGATIAYQFDYAGDFTDAGTAMTESNGWSCDIPICMDYYDSDQGWNEDISGWIRTSHPDYPQGFKEYSFHQIVTLDGVRIYPLASPPPPQKNIFTGVGNWSKVECWSLGRLPQPNDQVIIRGHCSMDMDLPSELSSLIIEDTSIPLPPRLKKVDLPEGKASLDMHHYALVNIPIIQNNGIILTQNRSKTPLPPGLEWQGLIVFNFHSILPIYHQYIPQGSYENLIIYGQKKVDAINTVRIVNELTVTNGADIELKKGQLLFFQNNH